MNPNILKITQTNKWFVVQFADQKVHMLNQRSLVYFLKNQVGLDSAGRASVIHMFEYQSTVEIDLERQVVAA